MTRPRPLTSILYISWRQPGWGKKTGSISFLLFFGSSPSYIDELQHSILFFSYLHESKETRLCQEDWISTFHFFGFSSSYFASFSSNFPNCSSSSYSWLAMTNTTSYHHGMPVKIKTISWSQHSMLVDIKTILSNRAPKLQHKIRF